MADLRHAPVDDIPVDVFLTDPGLALVHADMGAWLEAHPCVCPALCECENDLACEECEGRGVHVLDDGLGDDMRYTCASCHGSGRAA